MRHLLLKQTVIYQSFESSRHTHTSASAFTHCFILSLINAGNRQLLQSFPDMSQAEGLTSCHGTFGFFLCKLIDLLVSYSVCSLFLCLSCMFSPVGVMIIGVVIITRSTVWQVFLQIGMTHTEPLFYSLDDYRQQTHIQEFH